MRWQQVKDGNEIFGVCKKVKDGDETLRGKKVKDGDETVRGKKVKDGNKTLRRKKVKDGGETLRGNERVKDAMIQKGVVR